MKRKDARVAGGTVWIGAAVQLLVSAHRAINHSLDPAHEAWNASFVGSDHAVVAVGYASHDALMYLARLLELHPSKSLTLCIGLARFEGLTRSQREAAVALDKRLRDCDQGGVVIAHQAPFHGKVSVFHQGGRITSAILGSSNLGALVPQNSESRSVEVDIRIEEQSFVQQLGSFVQRLVTELSVSLEAVLDQIQVIPNTNTELNFATDVIVDDAGEEAEAYRRLSEVQFEIPLKDTPKSNLNTFFGAGRNLRPRHWYEVELILPKEVRTNPKFPKDDFLVRTDDGYLFACKTSGDEGKNLRSRGDLTVLGRWIKGRMEAEGCLRVGDPVTRDSLLAYGRTSLMMSDTGEQRWVGDELLEVWFLDFSPQHGTNT